MSDSVQEKIRLIARQHDIELDEQPLSQTPKNYSSKNYFSKELQDKVIADWEYRPNRVDIEFENSWGKQTYTPLEVVIQSVKSDKGEDISNDCRRVVFRDTHESRFDIGGRFRFDPTYDITLADDAKDVWITTNTNKASMTSSVVIERCNGTICNLVQDAQGVSTRHEEPVIQGRELSYVSLHYSETIVSPQSQLLIICQHNEYTKKYFINQRFIIGYDKVYRIKAINKFYANSTFLPKEDLSSMKGLMRIYLELTEKSPYDDFNNRVAYQMEPTVYLDHSVNAENCTIIFSTPTIIPSNITEEAIEFTPIVVDSTGTTVSSNVTTTWELTNWPTSVSASYWSSYISGPTQGQTGSFTLQRLKIYTFGDLVVTCSASIGGVVITTSFTLVTRNQV